ncbi:hypothetical protein PVAP13_2KG016500 [Panicum virgatum]|uniref:Uncharacterized protein n=1 Tax=Panicum virgatum TaxID=38727 RepID=A0A8T0VR89_PANVG|nr:hypothetical protein PVAP13_2KG016500 [Panicum virgatum]
MTPWTAAGGCRSCGGERVEQQERPRGGDPAVGEVLAEAGPAAPLVPPRLHHERLAQLVPLFLVERQDVAAMLAEHAVRRRGRGLPDGRVHGPHVLRERCIAAAAAAGGLPAGNGVGEGPELLRRPVDVVDVVEVDDEGLGGLGQHVPAVRQVRLRRDACCAEEALDDAVPREGQPLAQPALSFHLGELSPVKSSPSQVQDVVIVVLCACSALLVGDLVVCYSCSLVCITCVYII